VKALQEIDENSQVPKYKQVVKLVLSDIESGIYKSGDRIPSINETSEEYLIARDTVEKAYKELLQKNVIVSVKGKGYFVAREVSTSGLRICLVFNKLSTYKKAVYDSFVKTLDTRATVDLHV
jgi:DNA-binding GntR family transcriptional regulator